MTTIFGKPPMWDVFGATVRGAAHIKTDSPCQDAIFYKTCGQYVIAAVADGHGSRACPYSREGAEAAVLAAGKIFEEIVLSAGEESATVFEVLDGSKEIRLPRQLELSWKESIRQVHQEMQREEDEFQYLLYGTTILAVIACGEFVFALQLGDGDILCVTEGEARWLIEPENLGGSSTYSLCLDNAWQNVRTKMLRLAPEEAMMLMLTTDGYANSFATDQGFLKAGEDIAGLISAEGKAAVAEKLEGWLNTSSTEGSGDDITMAVLVREEEA